MDIKLTFENEGVVLAWVVELQQVNAPGLTFLSSPSDYLQVGVWNHPKDAILKSHIHNIHKKNTDRTSEAVIVLSGAIHADIFSENQLLIGSTTIAAGSVLVCLKGGHGYKILEENTKVLEIKNGPYFGPEVDRTTFESQCISCQLG